MNWSVKNCRHNYVRHPGIIYHTEIIKILLQRAKNGVRSGILKVSGSEAMKEKTLPLLKENNLQVKWAREELEVRNNLTYTVNRHIKNNA